MSSLNLLVFIPASVLKKKTMKKKIDASGSKVFTDTNAMQWILFGRSSYWEIFHISNVY